ncbi:asparaginase [Bradyrhizobium sp. AUGA SZCCT0431]|uniref:asparaginase n=1 Tax=Bradyrhizobium sp. AUGA SZCCT0431 TaxID=2807674 RepID=UPI001BAD45A1|nr:asparaginase [Bradyrhizobium sp. AUGA SZCCT0431]MBR1147733.1 asparaginase [Bradyrhizobium sp. AUGA SZCCT0431]
MDQPKIAVFALGGTIATQPGQSAGLIPTLTGEALVRTVPQLAELARLEVATFRQLPGPDLAFADLEALAAAIENAASEGADGIVVTQGTDTIEETAFVLDRIVASDIPVIVTGAMRSPVAPGADGPANLLAAVRVAASPAARGLGTLVVFDDDIHAARFVTKAHTSRPSAFRSRPSGPLGFVVEQRVRMVAHVNRLPPIGRCAAPQRHRVALVTLGLDDDGALIELAANQGYAGIVIEGYGGGHVSGVAAQAVSRVSPNIPVVIASRTGAGEVLSCTYGFPGSEIDLGKRGAIRAGWLDGIKARILLTLLLRHEANDIARHFALWGGGTAA